MSIIIYIYIKIKRERKRDILYIYIRWLKYHKIIILIMKQQQLKSQSMYAFNQSAFAMTRNMSFTMRINVRQSGSDLTRCWVEYSTDRRTATGNWPLGYQSLRFACLPSWAVNRRKGRKVWANGVGYPH